MDIIRETANPAIAGQPANVKYNTDTYKAKSPPRHWSRLLLCLNLL